MDPTTGWAIIPAFGLLAFLYATIRHLADTHDSDTPSLGASLLGALICAGILTWLLL